MIKPKRLKYDVQSDESFIETLIINNHQFDVYLSDYGQCYFLVFYDGKKIHEYSCGTYCENYREVVEYLSNKIK